MRRSSIVPPEKEVLHPAVENWLKENGYTYQHEVKMRRIGKADFVAISPSDKHIVVECKSFISDIEYAIWQVKRYCQQLCVPDITYFPVIATPIGILTQQQRGVCFDSEVGVIEVDVTQYFQEYKRRSEISAAQTTEMLKKLLPFLALTERPSQSNSIKTNTLTTARLMYVDLENKLLLIPELGWVTLSEVTEMNFVLNEADRYTPFMEALKNKVAKFSNDPDDPADPVDGEVILSIDTPVVGVCASFETDGTFSLWIMDGVTHDWIVDGFNSYKTLFDLLCFAAEKLSNHHLRFPLKQEQLIIREYIDELTPAFRTVAEHASIDFVTGAKLLKDGQS